LQEWSTYTPDGRQLIVWRVDGSWVVSCDGREARNELLDLALIEAMRHEQDTFTSDFGAWTRAQAGRIEVELRGEE
jgi:hypothetical protein